MSEGKLSFMEKLRLEILEKIEKSPMFLKLSEDKQEEVKKKIREDNILELRSLFISLKRIAKDEAKKDP